jgi:acyl-CoA reductase-like NAD-dependent aldehyde dehydrogenase
VEYGLASYIWTQDVSKVLRLARGIEARMFCVLKKSIFSPERIVINSMLKDEV